MWNRLLIALGLRARPLPVDPFGDAARLDVPNSAEFDATFKAMAANNLLGMH